MNLHTDKSKFLFNVYQESNDYSAGLLIPFRVFFILEQQIKYPKGYQIKRYQYKVKYLLRRLTPVFAAKNTENTGINPRKLSYYKFIISTSSAFIRFTQHTFRYQILYITQSRISRTFCNFTPFRGCQFSL